MFGVGVLCFLAALGIAMVTASFTSLNPFDVLILTWLAGGVASAGRQLKERRLEAKGVSWWGKALAACVVLVTLSTAGEFYVGLWQTQTGFWTKALLVWLGFVAFSIVWVPVAGGESEWSRARRLLNVG